MQVTHATAKDIETVVMLTALIITVFWRTALRLVLAVVAATALVLVGYGVLVFLQSAQK